MPKSDWPASLSRVVLGYVARVLGGIAKRIAARAERSESGSTTIAAHEYVDTGAATAGPPAAWLELVLRARARMQLHRAPGRPPPAQPERGERRADSAHRLPSTHAAPGESIHLTPAAPGAHEDGSAAQPRPQPNHTASPPTPDARAHDVSRHYVGERDDGSRSRLTSAAHLRTGQQQPRTRSPSPAKQEPEHAPGSDAASSPAAHPGLGEPAIHGERRAARIESPNAAPPDYNSQRVAERRPPIGRTSPSRPEPRPGFGLASSATQGEQELADDLRWAREARRTLHTPADARTSRSSSRSPSPARPLRFGVGIAPSLGDAGVATHAHPEWPELPDDDEALPDARLLLREWNRLQRIRAEQRGHTWNG